MTVERYSFRAPHGLRLDKFLAQALPERTREPISRRQVRRLIASGAVYLDGQRIRILSRTLKPGARLEVLLDAARIDATGGHEPPFELADDGVLFEDEHLIAVDKPPGIAVQATPEDDAGHLFAAVRRLLARCADRRRPYLALHHRLDRGTSGVVLFAKTRQANAGLAAAFRERRAGKLYLALVELGDEPPLAAWSVRDHLATRRIGPSGKQRAVSVAAGGREAETDFRLREPLDDCALVEARPKTGRHHQIRVHLAGSGAAVLGDRLYGPASCRHRAGRLMLHAATLALPHPVSGAALSVESPLPRDFRDLLVALRDRR